MNAPWVNAAYYQPDPVLDAELADLAYAAVSGWPDQRPVTPALVRSRLRHTGHALRWPPHAGATGRLWGPLVRPAAQRHGLGRALLDALTPHLSKAGGPVATAEIPASRRHGCALFQTAGWTITSYASLLRCPLPLPTPDHMNPHIRFRRPHPSEQLDELVAKHYALTYPGMHPDTARATLTRWSADERFHPDSMTLAEDDHGITAIALVYPLTHTSPAEPAEALLGDLLISPDTYFHPLLRRDLTIHALNVSRHSATVGRVITDDLHLASTLANAGFVLLDTVFSYGTVGRSTPAGN